MECAAKEDVSVSCHYELFGKANDCSPIEYSQNFIQGIAPASKERTVVWRLPNLKQQKEAHVAGSKLKFHPVPNIGYNICCS